MAERAELFIEFEKINPPDMAKLAELVRKAKGEGRTLSEFAQDCGVNASTLSRIINAKNSGLCTDKVLAQIALNAAPESNVTIDMLLEAQGRVSPPDARPPYEVLIEVAGREKPAMDSSSITESGSLDSPKEGIHENTGKEANALARLSAYAALMKGPYFQKKTIQQIVQDAVLEQGYTVALDKDKTAIKTLEEECDIMAEFVFCTDALKEERLNRWAFVELNGTESAAVSDVVRYLGYIYLDNPVDYGTRVTFYMGGYDIYQSLVRKLKGREIEASVSFLLVDAVARRVLDEFVMEKHNGKRYSCFSGIPEIESED